MLSIFFFSQNSPVAIWRFSANRVSNLNMTIDFLCFGAFESDPRPDLNQKSGALAEIIAICIAFWAVTFENTEKTMASLQKFLLLIPRQTWISPRATLWWISNQDVLLSTWCQRSDSWAITKALSDWQSSLPPVLDYLKYCFPAAANSFKLQSGADMCHILFSDWGSGTVDFPWQERGKLLLPKLYAYVDLEHLV